LAISSDPPPFGSHSPPKVPAARHACPMPCPTQPERASRRVAFGDAHRAPSARKRTEDTWRIPPRYEVKQMLGKGSYGEVCEAYDSAEKRLVAIKRIPHLFSEPTDCKRILREIAILSRLNYKHIVQILDIPPPSDLNKFNELYIVMEICDTDLKKLCRNDKVTLTPPHVNTLLYNLLLGLNYLHTAGVYHRDLTPGNCLVNRDLTIKICDFGLSRAVGSELQMQAAERHGHADRREKNLTAHVVTRWYRAPELILLQERYTQAIDVWSAGCIFAELLCLLEGTRIESRGPLFPGHTCFPMSPDPDHESDSKFHTSGLKDQMNVIFNVLGTPTEAEIEGQDRSDARRYLRRFAKRQGSGLKSRFGHLATEEVEMLERMLRFDPQKRLTVPEALEHGLFAGIRDPRKEVTAPSLVTLEFEAEKDLDEALLRKYLCKEMRKFHPDVPEL